MQLDFAVLHLPCSEFFSPDGFCRTYRMTFHRRASSKFVCFLCDFLMGTLFSYCSFPQGIGSSKSGLKRQLGCLLRSFRSRFGNLAGFMHTSGGHQGVLVCCLCAQLIVLSACYTFVFLMMCVKESKVISTGEWTVNMWCVQAKQCDVLMEISQLLLGLLCFLVLLTWGQLFLRSLGGGLCELFGTHLQPGGIFFQALCLGFRARV